MIRKQTFQRLCRERGVPMIATIRYNLVRDEQGMQLLREGSYTGRRDIWTQEMIESLLMYQYAWHRERWDGWFDDQ